MLELIDNNIGRILDWLELFGIIFGVIFLCVKWLRKTPTKTKQKITETTFKIIALTFLVLIGILTIFLAFQVEEAQKNHNELLKEHQALLADLSEQNSANIPTLLISQNEKLHQSSSKIIKMVLQEGRLAFWFIVYAFGFAVITTIKSRERETDLQNRVKELESWIKPDVQ